MAGDFIHRDRRPEHKWKPACHPDQRLASRDAGIRICYLSHRRNCGEGEETALFRIGACLRDLAVLVPSGYEVFQLTDFGREQSILELVTHRIRYIPFLSANLN